jgi:DNA-binding CsgD family transcriptional regulator
MNPRDRAALRAGVDRLRTIDAGEPLDAPRFAGKIARELHGLLGASDLAIVYRPARKKEDWIVAAEGPQANILSGSFPSAAALSPGFFLYDPLRPELSDRNVVQTHEREQFTAASRPLVEKFGARLRQTRMLLCDGPVLLAWIGIWRADGRDDGFEQHAVRTIAFAVRRRLRLALGVPPGMARSTFEASLDAYPGEAYVVRASGHVEYANRTGAARLTAAPLDLQDKLATAATRYPAPSPDFDLHPLGGASLPRFFLATRPSVAPIDLESRIEAARVRWQLTPRRVDVLRRLALGDSNKDIAARLQISIRTVEEHLAAMMPVAKVDSRLRLVVRVWKGD